MFEKNPALMATLFKDKYPKLADLALAYGMNQYSNSVAKTGKMAGGALNIPIEEWQKEDRKERKDAKACSEIYFLIISPKLKRLFRVALFLMSCIYMHLF